MKYLRKNFSLFILPIWLFANLACDLTSFEDNCIDPSASCFTEDTTVPTFTSSSPTGGSSVDATFTTLQLTFSEQLANATETANFTLSGTGAAALTIYTATIALNVVTVTLTGTVNNGPIIIDFSSLKDYNGNALTGTSSVSLTGDVSLVVSLLNTPLGVSSGSSASVYGSTSIQWSHNYTLSSGNNYAIQTGTTCDYSAAIDSTGSSTLDTAFSSGSNLSNTSVSSGTTVSTTINLAEFSTGDTTVLVCVENPTDGKSGQASVVVTRDNTVPTVSVDITAGSFSAAQTVTISGTDNVDRIIYTDDGSTPSFNSDGSINTGTLITGTYTTPSSGVTAIATTLKYMAIDVGGNVSAVSTDVYLIDTTLANITIASVQHSYVSIVAGSNTTTDITWSTDRTDNLAYTVELGSTCTGTALSSGTNVSGTTAGTTSITTTVNASDLVTSTTPTANTIIICVLNALSNYGYSSTIITGDDSLPTLSSFSPTVTGLTSSTAGLPPSSNIVLQFSKTMAYSSMSGTLSSEAATPVQSQNTFIDDTLTISPSSSWTSGDGRTLNLTMSDLAGHDLSGSLAFTYDVLNGVMYVHVSSGSNNNSGSQTNPRATISSALTYAQTQFSSGAIYVAGAAGTITYSENVTMVEGYSVYGGYDSSNWATARDSTTYLTTIQDPTPTGGSIGSPNFAVTFGSGLTGATTFDGFIVKGGGGSYTSGISITGGAAPIISANTVDGGTGTTEAYGLYANAAGSATLTANSISGATSGATSSYGIYNDSSTLSITSNTISTGVAASGSSTQEAALYFEGTASGTSSSNNITGGSDVDDVYGIYIAGHSGLNFFGNTISLNGNNRPSAEGAGLYDDSTSTGTINFYRNTFTIGTYSFGVPIVYGLRMSANYVGTYFIYNSVIDMGTTVQSYGIKEEGGGTNYIRNNTIDSGDPSFAGQLTNIYIKSASSIDNNILYCRDGGSACVALQEFAVTSLVSVRNNAFKNMHHIYVDSAYTVHLSVVSAFESYASMSSIASNNFEDSGSDINFNGAGSGDYTLVEATTLCSVLEGGIDGSTNSWSFGDDFTQTGRTIAGFTNCTTGGWSMGAYEHDY